ncbi:MAG: hypothetical protein DDG59_03480 [Anaerolineae bacterium]|jgi:hypothetical protein|nr:MAG: hypothetical protein DDG59_03480 [Anaerolineae bacterium]
MENADQLPLIFRIPPTISFVILASWLFMFVTSRYQMSRIRKKTNELIVRRASQLLETHPDITLNQFFEAILPDWMEMIPSVAWYILHKTELFPVPAKPEIVIKRINFSPEYVGRVLVENNIDLSGRDYKKIKKSYLAEKK